MIHYADKTFAEYYNREQIKARHAVDDIKWEDAIKRWGKEECDGDEWYETHRDRGNLLKMNAELQAKLAACEPYLKEGETPVECISRNRKDTSMAMGEWAKALKRLEAAEEKLFGALGCCKLTRYPPYHIIGVDMFALEKYLLEQKT